MSFQNLKKLDQGIQDAIFSEVFSSRHSLIFNTFFLNQQQINFIFDVEEKIWLKIISPLDLPRELEQMERAQYYDVRAIALELALNILWPLQEYLGEVDRLILRLGGKVPRLQSLKPAILDNKALPAQIKGAIQFLLEQYPDLKERRLSSAKILNKEERHVMPTLENWLFDYIHFLGAGYHDSLQRSQYLAKSPNILALSEKEKDNIRCFLLSYDEKVPLIVDSTDTILQLTLEQEETEVEKTHRIGLEEVIKKLGVDLEILKTKMLNDSLVLSEAANSLYKLRDVLWQSLAWQDAPKTLTCLKILIEKNALELLLQEDRRFQGLLRRFIDLRFGENIQWNIQDKLLVRRLFFEMILNDKLQLVNTQVVLAAFYLTNLSKNSGQIVYLDKNTQALKWRELRVDNRQIVWQESI